VSAIFETLDVGLAALAGASDPDAVRAESIRRLGGRVDPASSLAFVPFLSSRAVREELDVRDAFSLPSDRARRLAAMRRRENDLWVHLRESNVLTSTIYDGGREDSLFLFFTEDAVAMRPVYGVFNVLTGVGGGVAGLFSLPFDRGELLTDGLRGVLVSVPELFFGNIRKGSSDYLRAGPYEERELTPQPRSAGSPGLRDRSGSGPGGGSPPGSRAIRRVAVRGD
jgi:hypothetical protein